jgi:ATP-dependent Clp protease ATP-binding subunit ClpA
MAVEAVARIRDSAQLDRIGTDIRTVVGDGSEFVMRAPLADKIIALLQSGSNVLMRGVSGSGKTALARSLALAGWRTRETGQLRLVVDARHRSVPLIIETGAARFVEQCFYAHDLENKMSLVLQAALTRPAILFIDNTDECLGMGASSVDPQSDVAHLLLPHLERGLRVLGAATPEGEARLKAENPRLHGRFVVVDVEPPAAEEARAIAEVALAALARGGVEVAGGIVDSGSDLAARYFPGEAGLAAFLRLARRSAASEGIVTLPALRRAIAEELGVAPEYVGAAASPRYEEVREQLACEVFGQDQAVAEVADALVNYATGMTKRQRPIAAFLFAGPSGCGKTSLALAAARALTGSESSLVRVDLSEYSDHWATNRLLGDTHHSLTGRLLSAGAGVLLLDEIEKAHPSVIRLFLQALGESRLTGEDGRTARLDNFIVAITTNVGGRRWSYEYPEAKCASLVLADCSEAFPPEFRGRLTRTIVFRPLGADAARLVVERELEQVAELPGLAERGLQALFAPGLAEDLASLGVSVERGARGVQSVVRTLLVSPLARWLAENPHAEDGLVMIAPRRERGVLASLAIDWSDHGGFYGGTLH